MVGSATQSRQRGPGWGCANAESCISRRVGMLCLSSERGRVSTAARFAKCLSITVMVLMLTGCASILGRSQYPVAISSRPAGASITVTNRAGETVYNGCTPASVTLKSGAGWFKGEDYAVTFNKSGYGSTRAYVHRGVSMWYAVGNLFIGGLVGWLIVDPATGAMWTLDPQLAIDMPRLSAAESSGSGNLCIASIDQVPAHLRPRLVRVG